MLITKIKWKRKDGSVGIGFRADAGNDPVTGKRRRKVFATRGEAKQWLTKRPEPTTPDDIGITLAKIGEAYVADRKAAGRERSTYEKYEQHFKQHIEKLTFAWADTDSLEDEKLDGVTFGSMRPALMRPRHFLKLRAAVMATRSHAMVLRVWSTLSAALDLAVTNERITANPISRITIDRKPRETQEAVEIPTKKDIAIIIEAARPAPGEPIYIGQMMVALTLTSGLRPSEMRALSWDRLAIDKPPYHVTVDTRVDQWAQSGAPKSAAGFREVPLPESTVKLLREWQLKCPKVGNLNLVFPTGAGTYWNHSNIHNRI